MKLGRQMSESLRRDVGQAPFMLDVAFFNFVAKVRGEGKGRGGGAAVAGGGAGREEVGALAPGTAFTCAAAGSGGGEARPTGGYLRGCRHSCYAGAGAGAPWRGADVDACPAF